MGVRSNAGAVLIAVAIMLAAGLTACQTGRVAERSFPPEQRIGLESGGPHKGTAETFSVIVGYRYRLDEDRPQDRVMRIDGGLKRFKMKVSSVSLFLNFLDAKGATLKQEMVLAISNRQTRATFIRASRTFTTELAVPPETAYFAFHTRTQLSRGRR